MNDIKELVEILQKYNDAYRSGNPLVSDHEYDRLVESLRQSDPNHPFLLSVEPEKFKKKREIKHPVPMLSTEKAYSKEDLKRFVARVAKAADEININIVKFRVTPKLDGLAGRDDGSIFATRGNGEFGYEITNAFDKGVIPLGGRGLGIGEIVILKSYFQEHLAHIFEHPRNMVVGIVASDTLNDYAKKALQDEAVHFVPYAQLTSWEGSGDELIQLTDQIIAHVISETDYPMDGVVAEVIDERIKNTMGATSHHYRWQIAIKSKGETARTIVNDIMWQVGRTGNITPVLEVQPIQLSGATIRRVTAHHAGMIKEKRIGRNSEIEIIRSGEVIPKLENVITHSNEFNIPENCPVCKTELEWNNDFLKCTNSFCQAQVEQKLSHWFKTLGNADWFGIKTIQKLVANGYDNLDKIYAMKKEDFIKIGFGPVQAKNLVEAIDISQTTPVEDWRFLAAFGIPSLGKGDSRKLLQYMKLEQVIDATSTDIAAIHGFGELTSQVIEEGIKREKEMIEHMLASGFNLVRTEPDIHGFPDSPISGKKLVFTGKMKRGDRRSLQEEARKYGAIIQSTVSRKTEYLICGDNPGAEKVKKAQNEGVTIISEEKYFEMMKEFLHDG